MHYKICIIRNLHKIICNNLDIKSKLECLYYVKVLILQNKYIVILIFPVYSKVLQI